MAVNAIDPTELRVVLPRVLTSTSLRRALDAFPLVPKSDSITSLKCAFSPQPIVKTIVIDARELQDWSAEGLAAAQAFIAWLERIKSGDLTVEIVTTPPRGRAPFDHRFTFPQLAPELLKESPADRDVAITVEVQRSSESAVKTRELIEASSEQILALLQASFQDGFADYTVSQVVADFLQEGLLNVAEHAEPASPGGRERAWVSGRMYESATELSGILGSEKETDGIRE